MYLCIYLSQSVRIYLSLIYLCLSTSLSYRPPFSLSLSLSLSLCLSLYLSISVCSYLSLLNLSIYRGLWILIYLPISLGLYLRTRKVRMSSVVMYSCGPLQMDKQRQDDQLEPTHSIQHFIINCSDIILKKVKNYDRMISAERSKGQIWQLNKPGGMLDVWCLLKELL